MVKLNLEDETLYRTKINGIDFVLDDETEWDEYNQLWVVFALGDEGAYHLYYDEPEGEYELDDLDYDNPIEVENVTNQFTLDYIDGYKVIEKLKRVEDGSVDFMANAIRKCDNMPVQIGYVWSDDDFYARCVFTEDGVIEL